MELIKFIIIYSACNSTQAASNYFILILENQNLLTFCYSLFDLYTPNTPTVKHTFLVSNLILED